MSDYQVVEVVENPRKRRRARRKMSAKQRKYFGRRRNPTLATVVNPRRRRSRRSSRRRSYGRRFSNPSFLGGMPDLNSLLWMSGGAVATKMAPRLIANFWPAVPTTGIMGKLVQAGAAVALSQVVKMLAGQKAAREVLNGGLVLTVSEIISENIMPMIGLSGVSGYEYLTYDELQPALSGSGSGVAGYSYSAGNQEMVMA